jgi:hypothetical protein
MHSPKMKKLLLSLVVAASVFATPAYCQLKLPALSPTARISQDFSLSTIDITYSRPSMRGRRIFGDIIPFGKVWRTGANAATKIKIGEELDFAGVRVKPGEYAIYTIPNKDKWTVVINMGTSPWTAEGFSKEDDIARISVRADYIPTEVQTFTINITDITLNTCKLEMVWEHLKVAIPITARNNETIEANIDKAINQDQPQPYYKAASYYFETNQKTELARNYVNKAVEADPKAFYAWYLKARIEKKMGNFDEAVMAAKKSMEMAKGNANENEYLHNNQKIIDEIYSKSRPKQIDE